MEKTKGIRQIKGFLVSSPDFSIFFADKVPGGISARVRHNDYDASYEITFAWEGGIFLEVFFGLYGGEADLCLVRDDHYGPIFSERVPFTLEELRTRWVPQQLERALRSQERKISNSCKWLADMKIGKEESAIK